MPKITFLGAGSAVFVKNVIGDSMCAPALCSSEVALYDIDPVRLKESVEILTIMNHAINGDRMKITAYCGEGNRLEALRGANFVVNAIQVGFFEPSTVIDIEVPKKYGLRQTIGDTVGIGGIMRGLRTIPVMEAIAEDMVKVCPHAVLLNYTNPMAIVTGYMQRYTPITTIGLCHSVQICSQTLLTELGMEDKLEGRRERIAGINHMAWLLEILDKDGNDLYPEIRRRAIQANAAGPHKDMVRFAYIEHLGYYCTESSEHNAEYNPWFIKANRPDLIEKYNIPLDRMLIGVREMNMRWAAEKKQIMEEGTANHQRSREYASHIMEAMTADKPFRCNVNVQNTGLIDNLPREACVEVPCLVDGMGLLPCHVGSLPVALAALNSTNIGMQLATIEAARTRKMEDIYRAAMLDPHTGAQLSPVEIRNLCDDLVSAHKDYMKMYHK